jgi:hypothetical protein
MVLYKVAVNCRCDIAAPRRLLPRGAAALREKCGLSVYRCEESFAAGRTGFAVCAEIRRKRQKNTRRRPAGFKRRLYKKKEEEKMKKLILL